MTRKVWMLSSALLIASACSDDDPDSPAASNDGGRDASVTVDPSTANAGFIDSGIDSGSVDATIPPAVDSAVPADTSVPTDSAVPTDAAVVAAISIAGSWHDDAFGGTTEIDATTFGYANLIEYDNTTRTAITQNKPDDAFGPNQFSKVVWTPIVDGSFYYCTVGFGLDTLELARAANMPADATDPGNGGCGDLGFPWSHLVPAIEIAGNWLQGTTPVFIDSDKLGELTVEDYDNASNSAVTSVAGEADAGTPPKFSKLQWTQPTATTLYTCYLASGLNTAGDAADDTTAADPAQLTTGCLGGAWTAYTLAP